MKHHPVTAIRPVPAELLAEAPLRLVAVGRRFPHPRVVSACHGALTIELYRWRLVDEVVELIEQRTACRACRRACVVRVIR